jgi:hypothetical protein
MLIQFRIGQQIAGFGRLFHIAAHKFALATATSPNPAAVGEGQTFAQRGMCQRQSKSEPKGSAKCCHLGFGEIAA